MRRRVSGRCWCVLISTWPRASTSRIALARRQDDHLAELVRPTSDRRKVLNGSTTKLPGNAMFRVRVGFTLIGEALLSVLLILLSVLGSQRLAKHFGDLGFAIGFGLFGLGVFVFLDCVRRFRDAVRT